MDSSDPERREPEPHPAARLYLVLTPAICRTGPVETTRRAIDGGVGMVQLREKYLDDGAYAALAHELAALCHDRGVPLILNDRVHLVEPTGADGAHVGEADLAPEQAREILGPARLLGVSTHDRAEVAAAAARGADHVGLGPMFDTATKRLARRPQGAALLRAVAGATDLPVYPIGGITPANAAELVAAGATRLAVGAGICAAPDPEAAARALRALLPPC